MVSGMKKNAHPEEKRLLRFFYHREPDKGLFPDSET